MFVFDGARFRMSGAVRAGHRRAPGRHRLRRRARSARPRHLGDVARGLRVEAARASGAARGAGRRRSSAIGASYSGAPAGPRGTGQRPGPGPRRRPRRPRPRRRARRAGAPAARSARRGRPVPHDREHRDAGLDQRHRSVLEVRGGVRVGDDLRELLELERPLARGRVLEAAADDDAARRAAAWSAAIGARSRARARAPPRRAAGIAARRRVARRRQPVAEAAASTARASSSAV